MAETKTYAEQQNIKYTKKLNELLKILPPFVQNILTVLNIPNNRVPRLLMQWILKVFLNF